MVGPFHHAAGQPRRGIPGRRLDGRDRRRKTLGTVGAHGHCYRDWLRACDTPVSDDPKLLGCEPPRPSPSRTRSRLDAWLARRVTRDELGVPDSVAWVQRRPTPGACRWSPRYRTQTESFGSLLWHRQSRFPVPVPRSDPAVMRDDETPAYWNRRGDRESDQPDHNQAEHFRPSC